MSRMIARNALVGLSLIGGLAVVPVSALASAIAATDMTLSWYTWYDVDGSGNYNTGDTLVDTSTASLGADW